MKVAFVSYEVFPFAKVGGLADVAGTLPKYLEKQGIEVFVIMPKHKLVEKNAEKFGYKLEKVVSEIAVSHVKTDEKFDVYESTLPGSNVKTFFVANEYYFSADEVYAGPDLGEQSIFFSAATLDLLKHLDLKPDIVHVNDWQTALIPVYLKTLYRDDPFFSKTASVFTIHNLGYQGVFDPRYLSFAGLPDYVFTIDGLEFYGQINFLKGGIVFSDVINTVSPTYAKEIQTEEYGEKLDGVLRMRAKDLYGILNGIDYELYNPATDKRIYVNYDVNRIELKWENKVKLQEELGLPVRKEIALLGLISRLVPQKGLDLLIDIMDYLTLFDLQIVILGTGDDLYENALRKFQEKYPERVSTNIKFDVDLAQKIYAGADIFLMPSRYEPCGLGQMFSMRYGTVPVVRYTGGLADTVKEYDPQTLEGTGFGFKNYDSAHFLEAVSKALHFYYREKDHWKRIMVNAMNADFSWDRSAKEYVELYKKALAKVGR
ncbi:glycogen synthase [Thermotoga sp. KOL6]|uniref:glycogen synthase n=1 Tax=Thermotoga sp. KOL6 TaxID=126741 RepID=UPI000C78D900|nr:glycogen/starch synthase [Thermotoga sp. KOL6]PLV58374.1 glycogen synthase [Thermotoga sp. KOL6]